MHSLACVNNINDNADENDKVFVLIDNFIIHLTE